MLSNVIESEQFVAFKSCQIVLPCMLQEAARATIMRRYGSPDLLLFQQFPFMAHLESDPPIRSIRGVAEIATNADTNQQGQLEEESKPAPTLLAFVFSPLA